MLVFIGKIIEALIGSLFIALDRLILQSIFHFLKALFSILYLLLFFLFFEITIGVAFMMFLISAVLSAGLMLPKIETK